MDSFDGNLEDPVGLHKHLYCHDSPVDGVDPGGSHSLFKTVVTVGIALIVGNIAWNAIKPALQDRTTSNPNAVGPPGGWEDMIPAWGTGRNAVDELQNQRIHWLDQSMFSLLPPILRLLQKV